MVRFALLLSACTLSLRPADDALIACTDQCPDGLTCRAGRCVDPQNLDADAPDLQQAPITATDGDTIVITVHTTEAATSVTMRIETDTPIEIACVAIAETTYACRYTPTREENGGLGGVVPLTIIMTDAAGNTNTRRQSAFVTLDFTAPSIASFTLTPAVAPEGGVIQAFISASEPLSQPLVLTALGTDVLLEPDAGTLNYRFAHTVTSADAPGAHTFSAHLVDRAGNSTDVTLGQVTIDPVPLTLSALALNRTRFSVLNDALTVSFTSNKPLAALSASVGDTAITCDDEPLAHTCSYVFTGAEIAAATEQALTLFVAGEDAAGNRASTSAAVVLDLAPPRVALGVATYIPDSANPLQAPVRATAGTEVLLTLISNEALDTGFTPVLTAGPLTFALQSLQSGSAIFTATVPSGAADGSYAPELQWRDLAGNTAAPATLDTPVTVAVKTSLPSLGVEQTQVTFVRSPIGMGTEETLGAYEVPREAYAAIAGSDSLATTSELPLTAFTGAAAVRVWTTADKAELIGTLRPSATGWPRLRLLYRDVPTVFVSGLDDAGNESATTKLANAEWIATSRVPSVGTTPHTLHRVGTASSRFVATLPQAELAGAEGNAPDGNAAAVNGGPGWRQHTFSGHSPVTTQSSAVVYDPGRDRLVSINNAAQMEVYEHDGDVWTAVTPSTVDRPPSRTDFAAAYDGNSGRIILYGGFTDDMWSWDGTRWRQIAQQAPWPGVRGAHRMAFDAERGRVVMFGGHNGLTLTNDTWEWDGFTWTPIATTSPSARCHVALAFDPIAHQVTMFGGSADISFTGALHDDMYRWDGAAWQPVPQTGPSPRSGAYLAPQADGKLLLWGGRTSLLDYSDETWRFDGSWSPLNPATRPPARENAGGGLDLRRRTPVLFGGMNGGIASDNRAWDWDGSTWIERPVSSPQPSARYASMAYDPVQRGIVMVQGGTFAGPPRNDTWLLRGNVWTQAAVADLTPSRAAPVVFDRLSSRVFTYGGYDGNNPVQDTWALNWTPGADWGLLAPTGPAARSNHALAAGPSGVLLFGGLSGGRVRDVHLWNGSAWTALALPPAALTARYATAMAYDAYGGNFWLFGGDDNGNVFQPDRDDLWRYNGISWTSIANSGNWPQRRSAHAFVDASDGGRTRLLLFGGDTGPSTNPRNDLWEWNGAGWVDRSGGSGRPPVRSFPAAAYDPVARRLFVFGGIDIGGTLGDTWSADVSDGRRPAVQLTASFADAGFTKQQVTGIRVRGACDGAGGATLSAWASHGIGQAAPGWASLPAGCPTGLGLNACFTSADARRFVRGDGVIAAQCRPAEGSSATGEPWVSADYMEIRVRYSVP